MRSSKVVVAACAALVGANVALVAVLVAGLSERWIVACLVVVALAVAFAVPVLAKARRRFEEQLVRDGWKRDERGNLYWEDTES